MNPNPYTAVSLAIIDYNEQQYEAALEGFYEGYSAEPPHLMGCDCLCPLSWWSRGRVCTSGARLDSSRGCPNSAALKGLRTLLLARLGRWEDAKAMLAAEPEDREIRGLRW